MHLRLQIFFTIMAVCMAPVGTGAQDEIFYRVSGERLACLLENAQSYLEIDKDLLIIAINACPEISDDPLLAATANINPDIPDITDESLDRLIVVTKEELACLAQADVALDAAVYDVFPGTCSIRPGS